MQDLKITIQELEIQTGFTYLIPPRDSRSFNTPDKKAHFISHDLPDVSIPDDMFVMMTIRSHDQYNTTIYDLHDRYRGIHGNRRVVLMNANDMIERGGNQDTSLILSRTIMEKIEK